MLLRMLLQWFYRVQENHCVCCCPTGKGYPSVIVYWYDKVPYHQNIMHGFWSSPETTKHATSLDVFTCRRLSLCFLLVTCSRKAGLALSSTPCLPNMVQNIQGMHAMPAWFLEQGYSNYILSWNNYVYTQSLARLITKNLGWSLSHHFLIDLFFYPGFLPLTARHAVLEWKSRSSVVMHRNLEQSSNLKPAWPHGAADTAPHGSAPLLEGSTTTWLGKCLAKCFFT